MPEGLQFVHDPVAALYPMASGSFYYGSVGQLLLEATVQQCLYDLAL